MWRVGTKVPINVYDGNRPVCQCQTAADAKRIVDAVNSVERLRAENRAQRDEIAALENQLAAAGLAWD